MVVPTLQIRDLPDDLYQALSLDARNEHRSLTQQAIAELREAQTLRRQRRSQSVLETLTVCDRSFDFDALPPEQLIRADRER